MGEWSTVLGLVNDLSFEVPEVSTWLRDEEDEADEGEGDDEGEGHVHVHEGARAHVVALAQGLLLLVSQSVYQEAAVEVDDNEPDKSHYWIHNNTQPHLAVQYKCPHKLISKLIFSPPLEILGSYRL